MAYFEQGAFGPRTDPRSPALARNEPRMDPELSTSGVNTDASPLGHVFKNTSRSAAANRPSGRSNRHNHPF
jgi:hypothetical protein